MELDFTLVIFGRELSIAFGKPEGAEDEAADEPEKITPTWSVYGHPAAGDFTVSERGFGFQPGDQMIPEHYEDRSGAK